MVKGIRFSCDSLFDYFLRAFSVRIVKVLLTGGGETGDELRILQLYGVVRLFNVEEVPFDCPIHHTNIHRISSQHATQTIPVNPILSSFDRSEYSASKASSASVKNPND
ncbi:MAG TPA: hypothetical protein PK402_11020 [Tepidisphaeraceae bacterium]|nr:hypothetical protein [Tepidisphaeraceae bacterium]